MLWVEVDKIRPHRKREVAGAAGVIWDAAKRTVEMDRPHDTELTEDRSRCQSTDEQRFHSGK